MGVIGTLILVTALAGVVGTGLGGFIGALLQKDSNRAVSLLLGCGYRHRGDLFSELPH